jgi:hypothetical protein
MFPVTDGTGRAGEDSLRKKRSTRPRLSRLLTSGEKAHYVYQYFRADGTLAKAASQLNTFYGSMTVLRDFYFDRRGRLLRKTTRYRDLETQRPKKTAAPDFPDDEVRIYKTTARLPFAGLLR